MEDEGAYPAKGELVPLKASEVPFDGGKMDRELDGQVGWGQHVEDSDS